MKHLRRLLPPAALFAILVVLGLGGPGIGLRLGIGEPPENAGNALHFAIYLSLAWLLSRISGLLLGNLRPRSRPIPKLVKDLVSGLLFLIAIVSGVILMLGHGAGGALAGSGVVLALMGFAIRNVVADTLSGIALGLEGPFRIGDWVDVEGLGRGRVIEIGWRTTRLLTRDSTYVILPNSQVSRQRIVNYSAPSSVFRAQVELVLDHAIPAERGVEILQEALLQAPMIKRVPRPDVRVQSIGTDGVHYALRYWLDRFDREIECRDAIWRQVDKALREADATTPLRRITVMGAPPEPAGDMPAKTHVLSPQARSA
ncbi:mechanosensitive ion channel family protein [Paracoccus sp. SY]|uniref:mechanosensitive ion channel family protein n=1 Tax=Paracoccus sp. SY TaxID=1330255 RepID=UPI000CD0C94B|nr:mechanosensitive ion channel domain-containing protein [Paracoccus sp. SY]